MDMLPPRTAGEDSGGTRKQSAVKFALDLGLWLAATPAAFLLRLEGGVVDYETAIAALLVLGLLVKPATIWAMQWHRQSWSRLGIRDLYSLVKGIGLASLVWIGLAFFLPHEVTIPRSVPFIEALLALIALGTVRFAARRRYEGWHRQDGPTQAATQVLIVGASDEGVAVAREMIRRPGGGYAPVGFVDPEPLKQPASILGLRVLGGIDDLPSVLATHRVDQVLIALPTQGGTVVRRVVEHARAAGVAHRIIPGVYELVSGQVTVQEIRDVAVADLLRREPVHLQDKAIAGYLRERVVLVTGGGGSIGSEIARHVALFAPEKLVLLGRGENSVHAIGLEMAHRHAELDCETVVTDLRDEASLRDVFERFRPAVVFHAAAHKHVPLMEANPEQAVFNNVMGTKNLTDLALEFGVERLVNISTDKAVNPTSVMGASKRVAEQIVHCAARECAEGCAFVSVRFGNVLGSRGSVIPIFKQQIEQGGPVTVTHPDMKRYFMTIPEATQLVLQAGSQAVNGRVYVLDMGEAVRIVDLARDLIELSGKEVGADIEIAFTGRRPGEKLFEELLLAEEGMDTSEHEKIFVARQSSPDDAGLDHSLGDLLRAASDRDPEAIRAAFKAMVPSYRSTALGLDGEETEEPPAVPDAASEPSPVEYVA